jgi:hypothetical protein
MRSSPRWLRWLARRPVAGATVLGIFNAAVVEALFLAVQTAFGAEGVAANEAGADGTVGGMIVPATLGTLTACPGAVFG